MGLISAIGKAGEFGISQTFKHRITAGAIAGGVVGGYNADSAITDYNMFSIAGGAIAGAGLGMLTTGAALGAIGDVAIGSAGAVGRNAGGIARVGAHAGLKGASIGLSAMNFAINHPAMATGIGLGAYGAYSMASAPSQPTGVSGPAMQRAGITSTGFHRSSTGLVQGLHRNRRS